MFNSIKQTKLNFRTFALSILMLSGGTVMAQFEFETVYMDDYLTGTYDFEVMDVDGDGDEDIVSLSTVPYRGAQVFTYYENVSGRFHQRFFNHNMAERPWELIYGVHVGSDQNLDFYSKTGQSLIYFDQTNGGFTEQVWFDADNNQEGEYVYTVGEFNGSGLTDHVIFTVPELSIETRIQTAPGQFSSVVMPTNLRVSDVAIYDLPFYHQVIDIDADGVDELFLAGTNQVSGVFELHMYRFTDGVPNQTMISDQVTFGLFREVVKPIQFEDFTGDGLLDFVLIKNNGFTESSPVQYTQNQQGGFDESVMNITFSGGTRAYKSFLRDHDQDQDLDYLYLSVGGTGSDLVWLENDNGDFSQSSLLASFFFDDMNPVLEIDVDDSGPKELITSASLIMNLLTAENDYEPYIIEERLAPFGEIISSDTDQDGDADFLVSSGFISTLKYYQNDGNRIQPGQNFQFNRDIAGFEFMDLNGDTYLDIMFVLRNEINSPEERFELVQYINDGANHFNRSTSQLLPSSVFYGRTEFNDIDQDGDLDLLMVYDSSAYWYENQNQVYLAEQVILESYRGELDEHYALGDFDGDGDTDLIMSYRVCGFASCSNEKVVRYDFNQITRSFEFNQELLNDVSTHMTAGDVTGDGKDEFFYYYQGQSWVIDFSHQRATALASDFRFLEHDTDFFDVDGDGRNELLYLQRQSSDVLYYQFDAGLASTAKVFSNVNPFGVPLHYGFFNDDASLDMLAEDAPNGTLVMQSNLSSVRGPGAVPVPINRWSLLVSILAMLLATHQFKQRRKAFKSVLT